MFTYTQLSKAPHKFRKENLLGTGRFRSVYKGVNPSSTIAVKKISATSTQGSMSSACNSNQGGDDSEVTEDMMSKLPMELRLKIVDCMQIQDAVRASVLSRSWRYCWITVPHLVFDNSFYKNVFVDRDRDINGMIDIVSQILHLHSGPIYSFSVFLPGFLPEISYDIDQWLILLSNNGVKQIEVEDSCDIFFQSQQGQRELPSSIYSCLELTHLELYNCTLIQAPPEFKGFQHLTVLKLYDVFLQADMLENVVYRATLLQKLLLINCVGVEHFKFHGPNLKYLHILGEFKTISLTDTYDLADVMVYFSEPRFIEIVVHFHTLESNSWCSKGSEVEFILPERLEPGYVKVKGGLPGIEKLSFEGHAFKLFAADKDPDAPLLSRLKYLELNNINSDTSHFLCVLGLISSSPNLQEIIIVGLDSCQIEFDHSFPRSYGEVHGNCILNQLQTVKLIRMLHYSPEWDLVKFIIACAPSLEVLSFERCSLGDKDLDIKLLKEFMQCPGASPETKFEYLDPYEKSNYVWNGSAPV